MPNPNRTGIGLSSWCLGYWGLDLGFGMWALGFESDSIRLDVWLDVACLFRTRSEAKRACEAGKVDVNGDHAKPHRLIQEDDEILISRPFGRKQTVRVMAVAGSHMKKSDARTLYEDLTPKPTPAEIEARRVERVYRAAAAATGTEKRARREARRSKGKF
jgi:ribosome-associated heat shock protein Hsp15